MKRTKLYLTPALMILLSVSLAYTTLEAQWVGTFTTSNSYDDNIFGINEMQNGIINSNNLFIGYAPDSAHYALSYSGRLLFVGGIEDLGYNSHDLAYSYTYKYGDYSENSLAALLKGRARFNSDAYNTYNNTVLIAGINSEHEITQTFILSSGYYYRQKDYNNSPDLSYSEHEVFTGFRKYLETNTSIHINAAYQIKSANSVFGSLFEKGKNGNSGESFSQMEISAKVGQSLAEKTGLSLMYKRKFDLGSENYSGTMSYIDYFMETELYDDPYSYQSNEYSLTLTQIFPWSIMAKLSGFYADKSYNYLVDNQIDKRSDSYSGISLFAQKSFRLDSGVIRYINVSMNYSYINNDTNLDYFRYHNNSLGINFSFGL